MGGARTIHELRTPALLVDAEAFDHNLSTMAAALPGPRLRPHVKAHKSTALARRQVEAGHRSFTCATVREVEGMAAAGLGQDLLLANETLETERLAAVRDAEVMLAVDSDATVEAAAAGRVRRVVIDVNVGMPRCGCPPDDAGRLADLARAKGLEVRGVMGYEGHVVGLPNRATRTAMTEDSMKALLRAHDAVGGDLISAGGTGTFDINPWATEIQAGSYILMDNAYAELDLPFRRALSILATVISAWPSHAVVNCGLKALGMDHGNPTMEDGHQVWFVSDEHITFTSATQVKVGDRLRVLPAHVDPTVAYHERMFVVDGETVVDEWPVDLRGW
ncbi:MAG: alanine racemase [Actinomycetota bacterium]|nr:alanine racemase [Actinomycetota bacterium]